MAELSGRGVAIEASNTASIDATQRHILGTRAFDTSGNEYIYLKGLDSTVDGSWVSFDEAHVTTLLVADAIGRVAIACAITVTDTFGWYIIYGYKVKALAVDDGDCAADVALYATSSAAKVDDAHVTGDLIVGAISRVAETVTADQISVELTYPCIHNDDNLVT